MPATQQQIDDLETALAALAQTNYDTQIDLAETLEAIGEADDALETIKAEKLSFVLNDRFEINQKLKYTNDDQRKVATLEAVNNDADFIGYQAARKILIETQAAQKAEIEKTRALHKAKLLVLTFYASLP